MNIDIREIRNEDVAIAGQIIYNAFAGVSTAHGFEPDFPSVEVATGFANMWLAHPNVAGFAAEIDGRFVGSNFLTEYDPIRGVGPITVDPAVQASGIGRKLMEAVIERGRDAIGIRLVQAAFNSRSMSLYTSLGFDVREPLAMMTGKPKGVVSSGTEVRPMKHEDLDECDELCRRVHGISRRGDLELSLAYFTPFVALRSGSIVAYTTTVSMWALNHGVAETETDMFDILIGASAQLQQPVSFLLPTRQANFHRWALAAGLRMSMPLTLMTMGEYREPAACYFTSVLY
jgi:GNAT superfamily N-acetyltransferase